MRIWADPINSLADTSLYLPFSPNRTCLLKAVRPTILVVNNPTFVGLVAKVYSDLGGVPATLLATSSNVQTKAQITTLSNAIKTIWFEFEPVVPLAYGEQYHIVLAKSSGTYTYSDSSHLAWARDFPTPKNLDGRAVTSMVQVGVSPLACEFFTGDF